MNILITGGTGFIGSALVRQLVQAGCQVTILTRAQSSLRRLQAVLGKIQVIKGDLLVPEQVEACVKENKPEMCCHLAWYAEPGKYLSSPLNLGYIQAGLHLAQRLAENGCKKLVVAGSVAEYDSGYGYLSETTPTQPVTLYAACKLALYTALSQWAAQVSFPTLWARIFYVYGPFEDERRFVPSVINSLLQGEPTRLTPGEQVRDYLHVEDVAGAIWAAAQSDLTGLVNIGSGTPVTNRQVAWLLGELTACPELVRFGDLPYREGDPMFVCANTQRLRQATGWQPKFWLSDGLIDTVDWWQSQGKGEKKAP